MPQFDMKATSELTGLSEHALRAWEKRYQAVTPQRNAAGRRVYSSLEIQRLKKLAALTSRGHSISKLSKMSNGSLSQLLDATQQFSSFESNEKVPFSKMAPAFKDLLAALKGYDVPQLETLLRKTMFNHSPREIVFDLVIPLLKEVGQLVENETLSIAQEHIISESLRNALGGFYESTLARNGKDRPATIVIGTLQGDLHQFGILLSAILCRVHEFNTVYLGPNLPVNEITNCVKKVGASVLVLGTTAHRGAQADSKLSDLFSASSKQIPSTTKVWVGGSALASKKIRIPKSWVTLKSLDELEQRLVQYKEGRLK